MIRLGGIKTNHKPLLGNKCNFIVGEAKTSTTIMKTQLLKYAATGFFNSAIEIHPNKSKPSLPEFNLINIDKNYKISFTISQAKLQIVDHGQQKQYLDWLMIYIKLHLFANFTNDELNEYHVKTLHSRIEESSDIVYLAKSLSIEEIIQKITSLPS